MKLIISAAAFFLISTASLAKTCELSLESNDQMQYNTKELMVEKDCTEVKINLKHTGKLPKSAMGHNVVITTEKDMQPVVGEAMKAGLVKEYVPTGDPRIVASTKLIGGGESTSTSFKTSALKSDQTYKFFCTFPGHSGVMVGNLIVKK